MQRADLAIQPERESSPAKLSRLSATSYPEVSVIIPVFNEERSLPLVLQELPSVARVIVVDNGSTDRSSEVAAAHGAEVVREARRGYGSACLAGMERLQELLRDGRIDDEIVVFLDGDYSDYPEDLAVLVAPILCDEYDFVLGSRLMGERERGAMPFQSIYGNKLACFLMWLFWGARYSDLGPFRAISWTALQKLQMCDRNFGWTVEMQIKSALAGLRVIELPVRYRKRVGVSKISGTVSGTIKAGYKILYTIARYRWTTWWSQ